MTSPERLAKQIRTFDNSAPDADERMKQIIKDAEDGGEKHMEAVLDALAKDDKSSTAGPPSVYDVATGRPAFHESNVLLELRVHVNGRLFTARESVDPMMFEPQLGKAGFETFIRFFIQASCGRLAIDPEAYAYFRSLVTVVHPEDQHDLKRCADGPAATPYCDKGLISKASRIFPAVDAAIEPTVTREDVLGTCPCRCHRRNGAADHLRRLAQAYKLPTFDEDMLDENGFPR